MVEHQRRGEKVQSHFRQGSSLSALPRQDQAAEPGAQSHFHIDAKPRFESRDKTPSNADRLQVLAAGRVMRAEHASSTKLRTAPAQVSGTLRAEVSHEGEIRVQPRKTTDIERRPRMMPAVNPRMRAVRNRSNEAFANLRDAVKYDDVKYDAARSRFKNVSTRSGIPWHSNALDERSVSAGRDWVYFRSVSPSFLRSHVQDYVSSWVTFAIIIFLILVGLHLLVRRFLNVDGSRFFHLAGDGRVNTSARWPVRKKSSRPRRTSNSDGLDGMAWRASDTPVSMQSDGLDSSDMACLMRDSADAEDDRYSDSLSPSGSPSLEGIRAIRSASHSLGQSMHLTTASTVTEKAFGKSALRSPRASDEDRQEATSSPRRVDFQINAFDTLSTARMAACRKAEDSDDPNRNRAQTK